MQPDQTVSEMALEVLERQAKALAERSGRPLDEAIVVVLKTEPAENSEISGTGPTAKRASKRRQVEAAKERARARSEDLGKRLGEAPGSPTHG